MLWTIKEEKEAMRLRKEGLTIVTIAEIMGRSEDSIHKKLLKKGCRSEEYVWWTNEEWEEAQRLKNECTYEQIAAHLCYKFGTARSSRSVEHKFIRERNKIKRRMNNE